VSDGAVHATPVVQGRRLADVIAVNGLVPGQQVVLRPSDRLDDGMQVKVAKP
jgi:hypothetical protein